ncbi:hypothetical protein VNO77_37911 [Canavalia gladiata]|uniref:Uncharacterized protein n=1 Tax=Canavalia gladiata TaxID=3824 RepID=A0AAN9K987_CANGL
MHEWTHDVLVYMALMDSTTFQTTFMHYKKLVIKDNTLKIFKNPKTLACHTHTGMFGMDLIVLDMPATTSLGSVDLQLRTVLGGVLLFSLCLPVLLPAEADLGEEDADPSTLQRRVACPNFLSFPRSPQKPLNYPLLSPGF